jgi:hypothetical protein
MIHYYNDGDGEKMTANGYQLLTAQLGESRMLPSKKEELNRKFCRSVGSGGRVVNKFSSPPAGILTEFPLVIYVSLYPCSGFFPSGDIFKPATVIFPAAGYRDGGSLNVGYSVYYWSSSVSTASDAYDLGFSSGNVAPGNYGYSRSNGFPVRCVQEL